MGKGPGEKCQAVQAKPSPQRRRSKEVKAKAPKTKLLHSEPLAEFKGNTLYHETYLLPTGREKEYPILRRPDAVAVLVVDQEKESFLLVNQPRPAVGADDLTELPAGKIDEEGQSSLETAQRELAEEVGLEASEWKTLKQGSLPSPGYTSEKIDIYRASGTSPVSSREEDAHINGRWVPFDQLDQTIEETEDLKTVFALQELQIEILKKKLEASQ
jgi:8-oxo-dGTP pyrophosphatase MutT (NUDIX family)